MNDKFFDTLELNTILCRLADSCVSEPAKEKALVEQKAKKEAIAAERKNAAECVEAKRKALVEAQKAYREELSNFCKKFGAYHYSVQPGEGVFDFWSSIFDNFWL